MEQEHKTLEETHRYWIKPWDSQNQARDYAAEDENLALRSRMLVGLAGKYLDPEARILELGCNVGRNLNFLHQAGFRSLEAVEISPDAIALMKQTFPDMAASAVIHNDTIENLVKGFPDNSYDLVFTMAVLEHVHTESEWVFPEMARVAGKYLLTVEDEAQLSWRHFPRNYGEIFGKGCGLEPVEDFRCVLEKHGLGKSFMTRVFRKR